MVTNTAMKRISEPLLYLTLLLFACSCGSKKTLVTNDRSTVDCVYVVERPVMVNVPGAVVQTQSINIDSLATLLKSGVPPQVINRTLVKEDPETGLRLGVIIDELGNLSALCEQQDRMIQMMQTEINRLRLELSETTTEVVKTRLPNWFIVACIIAGLALIVYVALKIYPFPRF